MNYILELIHDLRAAFSAAVNTWRFNRRFGYTGRRAGDLPF